MEKLSAWALRVTLLFLVSPTALAGIKSMTVIYDRGGESIAPYMEDMQPVDREGNAIQQPPPFQIGNPRALTLPVITKEMRPGKLSKSFIKRNFTNLTHPLVITGADSMSLQWLQQNKKELKLIGALGVLVQAQSERDLQKAEQASGIQMNPINGGEFARVFGVRNYPVLITMDGIYQ